MKPRRITATEAARSFSEVLNQVKYRGESFEIERGGVPIARLVPVEQPQPFRLSDLVALAPRDPGFADDIGEAQKRGNADEEPKDPWAA